MDKGGHRLMVGQPWAWSTLPEVFGKSPGQLGLRNMFETTGPAIHVTLRILGSAPLQYKHMRSPTFGAVPSLQVIDSGSKPRHD